MYGHMHSTEHTISKWLPDTSSGTPKIDIDLYIPNQQVLQISLFHKYRENFKYGNHGILEKITYLCFINVVWFA